MGPTVTLILYCVLVFVASLAGGWLSFLFRLTHARMQLLVSFVGGLMLGVGLLHLLPHAAAETQSIDQAVNWTVFGLLTTFFMIRIFHFHQHATAEEMEPQQEHDCGHDHDHDHDSHSHGAMPGHKLSWVGVAVGLVLHSLIDGVALAAAIEVEALGQTAFASYGLGTFLAVVLHKPLDSMSISSLMLLGGWSANWRRMVNVGFALICPIGAVLFFFGLEKVTLSQHVFVGCSVAFAAGVFLCISLADLLPELQFHSHDRLKLSAALLAGVALAYAIGVFEPKHAHGPHGHGHSHQSVGAGPDYSLYRH